MADANDPAPNSRTEMVCAARDLMLRKGFPATGVGEVCAAAGVSKGSFYHHFASKDELGLSVIDCYFDDLAGALQMGAYQEVVHPVSRLMAFLDHVIEVAAGPVLERGCVLGSLALDMSDESASYRSALADRFSRLSRIVSDLIRPADIKGCADADALADQLIVVLEGSIVLSKAFADPSCTVRGLALYRSHLALSLGIDEPDR